MNETGDSEELIVVPDANMLIHGKALVNLPWSSLGREAIAVAYAAPVIREIDKLKTQSGRPNKLARKVSEDVRAIHKAGGSLFLNLPDGKSLCRRLSAKAVTTPLNDSLDLTHADHNLINHCLSLMNDGADVLLLTDDTICAMTAESVGVAVLLAPDDWLRDPEPDERERQNQRLKEQVRQLIAAEPMIEVEFSDASGSRMEKLEATTENWAPLTDDEVAELMAIVEAGCPIATDFSRPKTATMGVAAQIQALASYPYHSTYTPATEEEIETFRSKDYPAWLDTVRSRLKDLHDSLYGDSSWPRFRLLASNEGSRPASEVLFKVLAKGAFDIENIEPGEEDSEDEDRLKRKRDLALPLPPTPPLGRTRVEGFAHRLWDDSVRMAEIVGPPNLGRPYIPPKRDEDRFYWRTGRSDPVERFELECKIWRHGEDGLGFEIAVLPDERTGADGAVQVEIHAANLSKPKIAKLPVNLSSTPGRTLERAKDLVDQLIESSKRKGVLRR